MDPKGYVWIRCPEPEHPNAKLWHVHQPKGASVEDTVRWARWFLKEYGEEFPE
jgi:hypothetical protein